MDDEEETAAVGEDIGSRRDDFLAKDAAAIGFLDAGAAFVIRFAAVSGMAVKRLRSGCETGSEDDQSRCAEEAVQPAPLSCWHCQLS